MPPCGTLTSKHMQIFVPRFVPSLLRNKEHTMWPPRPHLHVILHFLVFARAAQNSHTPGGNAAVERCKKAYMTASVHLTLTQHCCWGAGRIQQISAAGPIFQKLKSVAGSILWQLTTPLQAQYFRSKHGHITA